MDRLFFAVFCVGCALAGLAGVVVAPVFSASTGMGVSILIPTLIVVLAGGRGLCGAAEYRLARRRKQPGQRRDPRHA